jgi:hypothetical protein
MDVILARIRELAAAELVRVTQHAQVEMDADEVTLDEVLDVIVAGQILENYPEHRRGPCCLLCGRSFRGRFLHIVCTTADPLLTIITVYEPALPKWISPVQRRRE